MRFVIVAAMAPAIAGAQSFTGLGFLPGGQSSQSWDVSLDGAVVVGRATSPDGSYRAFRWSRPEGMVNLGTLGSYSEARGTNADGSVVVGFTNSPSGFRAFRWTRAGGLAPLSVLPGGTFSTGRAVSADGNVVLGIGDSPLCACNVGVRWDAAGIASLGVPPGKSPMVQTEGLSADGAIAVGSVHTGGIGGLTTAFRWTSATGLALIGGLPGDGYSVAYGANADGSVVVGVSIEDPGGGPLRAFRWVNGASENLGLAPGQANAAALAVNADGSVVVGSTGARALLWRRELGMVDLNARLSSLGVNLAGWTLTSALAVSADGNTVAGYGEHDGATEAWIAEIGCYANCDDSTVPPVLNVLDFFCFLNSFTSGETSANCDASTAVPLLNVQDFICFINRFVSGCG